MSDEPNQTNPNGPKENKKLSLFVLPLAFLPSVMLLAFLKFINPRDVKDFMIFAMTGISIFCCLYSARQLALRNTTLTITLALLFFLLNGAVSFFFGCTAYFSQIKFGPH